MTGMPGVAEFRTLLAARLGWAFAESDAPQLTTVLARRLAALGLARRDYLDRLAAGGSPDELVALAEELTITETYFFRHAEQFRALREKALPDLIAARAGRRALRLLSVGCSSGEEPYTLAMVARQAQPDPSWPVSVLGLDANPAMLGKAATASYSSWSLRETPAFVRDQWFQERDGRYELAAEIQASVRFRQYNVADDDPELWQPEQYDVIFCRNLLMYLTPDTHDTLIARITRALAPGGYLFLGHTDSLGSHPDGLEPIQSHRTFYYRRRAGETAPPAVPDRPGPGLRRKVPAPPPGPDVHEHAITLVAAERFAEALAVLDAGLRDRPQPRDLLLRAMLLANAGRLDEAELVCRQLLDTDGLYADAHHLLAVCLEDSASADAAIGHYRLAGYLDASFAMPRLRLGLLARRRGEPGAAGPELERALTLLRAETEERIVLFGGGFGRAALTALCRAELDAIGVRR